MNYIVLDLVAQWCMTLCDSMDCSPPDTSVHGDSPGKNIGVGCHVLLQGILPTQGSNPGLPHCRQNLYCLSHREAQHQAILHAQSQQINLLKGNGLNAAQILCLSTLQALYLHAPLLSNKVPPKISEL